MDKINLNGSKILIVDDGSENVRLLDLVLRKHYTLASAENGQEALDMVEDFNPDLILMDINMPIMNGYEATTRLKANPKTRAIPVMIITSLMDNEEIIKGFEVGAVDFITKPISIEEMRQRVVTHLSLKKSQDLILDQNEKLELLNASKDKFFSIISHDLRGPFAGALGLTDLIVSDPEDFSKDDILEIILNINKSQHKQLELIEDLLDWSRIQTGNLKINKESLDIRKLVEKALFLIEEKAKTKNIKLISDIGENETVYADKFMIAGVLRNLIGNAVKFTPEGGEIKVFSVSDDENITIHIKDNGLGISENDMNKLFKIDSSHSTIGTGQEKGSGLGLILCKEFINQNGGELGVESLVGSKGGSDFYFTLSKK
jgi:two-component system, sensor histidine kinase and response regulator